MHVLSPLGDLLHVRKQSRNNMTFAICNQKGFALNDFNLSVFIYSIYQLVGDQTI